MNLVLVRSCCNRPDAEHTGVVCPDGLIECVECLQRVEWPQLSKDADGAIVNVCIACDICVPLAHTG